MNLLSDILIYIRRIIKSPSDTTVTDQLLIDYVNRFYLMDVDARMQLFDLKTKYQFMTTPGVDQYNMPLYDVQTETEDPLQQIAMFPVYQGFLGPAFINGIQVPLQTQKNNFFNIWPNIVQNVIVAQGDDGYTYQLKVPILPNFLNPPNPPLQGLLRGHIDITGIIATGNNVDPPVTSSFISLADGTVDIPTTSVNPMVYITSIDETGANVVVTDSGQFLTGNVNYGLLMQPGNAPFGNTSLGDYDVNTNTINYFTGIINVTFPVPIPLGNNIYVQCFYFQTGLPRSILFYNNVLTLRSPPDQQYLVELDAYLTPTAFFNTGDAIPFAYMAEYIARGAARKYLSDVGDIEQFMFYEPLFKEQELLVWKRSQRILTSTRTETIYSQGMSYGQGGFTGMGAATI